MKILRVLLTIFLACAGSVSAIAWSEQVIQNMILAEGFVCVDKYDAETILHQLRGESVLGLELQTALERCRYGTVPARNEREQRFQILIVPTDQTPSYIVVVGQADRGLLVIRKAEAK